MALHQPVTFENGVGNKIIRALDYGAFTDIELAAAGAGNRDSAAFSELVRRHYSACLRAANAILRNPADAEDEVQNALLRAYVHLPSFEFRGDFRKWLLRIVANCCLLRMRGARRLRMASLNDDACDVFSDRSTARQARFYSPSPNPEEESFRKEAASEVRASLGALPLILRDAIILQEIEGMKVAAVARRLGTSVPATKSRLRRARRELRTRLTRRLFTGQ